MTIPGVRFVPGDDFLTDWFSRGADNMILRGQRVNCETSAELDVAIKICTKNPDETGDGTVVQDNGGSDYVLALNEDDPDGEIKQIFVTSILTSGRGLKQLIRLKISTTGSAGGWLLGRIFPPIFYDSAAP